jgi:hypothetical protein
MGDVVAGMTISMSEALVLKVRRDYREVFSHVDALIH